MKVRELIDHLNKLDQDLPVCIHNDGFWQEIRNAPFQTESEFDQSQNIIAIYVD